MKVNYLKNSINQSLKPLYFVTGEDAYLVDSALNIFKQYILGDMPELNLSIVEEGQLREVFNQAFMMPFMADYRLIIVKGLLSKTNDIDKNILKEYISNPSDTAVVVFVESSLDTVKEFKSDLVDYVDCSYLDLGECEQLLREYAAQHSIVADNAVYKMIVEYTDRDMSRATIEISKLADYKQGTITIQDVELMVTKDVEYAVFELSNAIGVGNSKKAMNVLASLIATNLSPMAILSTITNYYRRMLLFSLSDATVDELAKAYKIKPYAVDKARQSAKSYTQRNLKAIVDKLEEIEYMFKKGMYQEAMALNIAIYECLNIKRG